MSQQPRYRPARVGGCLQAQVTQRDDGCTLLHSTEALGLVPHSLCQRLAHWAAVAPQRTLVAQRVPGGGAWQHISFAQMLGRARAVGQALVDRGLSPERPVALLSDNDLDNFTLCMGAMWAGVPWVPVSPAYSLLSQDFARLRHILGVATPGLVFASGAAYARAIAAAVPTDTEVVLSRGELEDRAHTPFASVLATRPGPGIVAAQERVGPQTIAKLLFTSGSTLQPKGVINTHGMWCANLQMVSQAMAFLSDEPPVLVDWLPWTHTFGANQNIGLCLYHGGTLYIDEGRPTAAGMAQTLANLREISPTIYFNVPKGFEALSLAMEDDKVLRRRVFSKVQAFMFAGAGLSQAVWDRLDRLAEDTVGERIPIITGLGMTETAPACTFAVRPDIRSGHIGLPCPGVEVKLVPVGDKTEVRFRGPHVMPGYWRAPQQSAQAFDEEGFYRSGDAVRWVDETDPQRGLMFDGRLAEDFKLSSGSFVSVGPLRARVIAAGDPLVLDAVVTGINRDDVGLLIFVRLDELRTRFALTPEPSASRALKQPAVRAFFQDMLDRLWAEGSGGTNRLARAMLMSEPPAIDKGEVTDKGTLNQRAVLSHRAALVERLHADGADGADADVLLARRA